MYDCHKCHNMCRDIASRTVITKYHRASLQDCVVLKVVVIKMLLENELLFSLEWLNEPRTTKKQQRIVNFKRQAAKFGKQTLWDFVLGNLLFRVINFFETDYVPYMTPLKRKNNPVLVCMLFNNYWMRLSMISWIIKTEVCVICRCRRLRQITQTSVLIIHDIMRKPNSIIVLLYIFHIIHPQKQKRGVQPFCYWGEHSKGLSNQADFEHMINAISAADIAVIMSSSQDWMLSTNQIFHSESDV